jgi:chemotaxis protein methyltransferase CheR
MYFTPAKTRKAIENLYRCLVDGGWLVVSPSEASHTLFPQFELRNFPGVILYRKREGEFRGRQPRTQPPIIEGAQPVSSTYEETILRPSLVSADPVIEPKPLSTPENLGPQTALPRRYAIAESFYREGRYEEAAATLMDSIDGQATEQRRYSLLARSLANRGNLIEALAWCERWIATDKLDFLAYYLSAVILMERGDTEYARRSLQSALYLKPDFPLAHFAFGNLARSQDRNHEANKHYTNALHLLNGFQPDEILPESDGLTVGRLAETIAALTFSGDRQ